VCRRLVETALVAQLLATRAKMQLCLHNTLAAHNFAPIDNYLAQFGIANKPPLDVVYSNATSKLALHGSLTEVLTANPLLQEPPSVTWPANEGCSFTLAFMDLGPDLGGTKLKTPFSPFVHSLWTKCKASLADCAVTIKPYLGPGNPHAAPNRYTYILFRHRAQSDKLVLFGGMAERLAGRDSKTTAASLKRWGGFSIGRLLRENAGLSAVAVNFANVRGQ